MATLRLTELLEREVVALDDAESIGNVESVVLDDRGGAVSALRVGGRKRSPDLVPWTAISDVGGAAVMVRRHDAVTHGHAGEHALAYTRGDIKVLGARVLDDRGFDRGEVTEVHLDAASGDVIAYLTTAAGRVERRSVRGLGTHALVIAAPDDVDA